MSDLLAIDVGNSTTKVGLFAGARLTLTLNFATAQASVPFIRAALARALRRKGRSAQRVTDLAFCTVVPRARASWHKVARLLGVRIFSITGETPTPLENAYRDPAALGPDRLAAAVAAAHVCGTPVIAVTFGTATTVDAVSADGRFLGGAICLGVGAALEALGSATSLLPRVAPARVGSAIGSDTRRSILAGSYYGTIGQVNEIIARQRAVVGQHAPVVVSGGFARLVAGKMGSGVVIRQNLTLRGIRLIWEYNRAHPKGLA